MMDLIAWGVMPLVSAWPLVVAVFSSSAHADACTDSEILELFCGDSYLVQMSTTGTSDLYDYSDCNSVSQYGPDHAFPFECDFTGPVVFSMQDNDCDMDIYALTDTCDGDDECVDHNTWGFSPPVNSRVCVLCRPEDEIEAHDRELGKKFKKRKDELNFKYWTNTEN